MPHLAPKNDNRDFGGERISPVMTALPYRTADEIISRNDRWPWSVRLGIDQTNTYFVVLSTNRSQSRLSVRMSPGKDVYLLLETDLPSPKMFLAVDSTDKVKDATYRIRLKERDLLDIGNLTRFLGARPRRRFPSWAEYVQSLGVDEPKPEQVAQLFIGINRQVTQGDFDEIDSVLREIDIKKISTAMLVALARGTFAYRTSLRSWSGFIEEVEAVLRRRGLDTAKLLRGLQADVVSRT